VGFAHPDPREEKRKKISLGDVTVRLNGVDITAQFLANHATRT